MDIEGKRTRISQYIKDEEARLLQDNALIRHRWMEWFPKLLNTMSPTLDPNIVDELKQWPRRRSPDGVPSRYELEEAIRALGNGKAVGPDGLPSELRSWPTKENRTRSKSSTRSRSLCGEEVACRNSRQVQRLGFCSRRIIGQNVATIVVSHAGTVLLKNIPGRLGDYSECENILPEEECGFRTQPATVDMMFVVRRLQDLTRKKDTPLYL